MHTHSVRIHTHPTTLAQHKFSLFLVHAYVLDIGTHTFELKWSVHGFVIVRFSIRSHLKPTKIQLIINNKRETNIENT